MDFKSIIMNPLGRTVMLILFLAVFVGMASNINAWFLFTEDTGTIDYRRIDRVVFEKTGAGEDADTSWKGATLDSTGDALSTGKYMLVGDNGSGGCVLEAGTIASNPLSGYGPDGEKVAMAANGVLTDCKWTETDSLFANAFSLGIIRIILDAGFLALPVAVMLSLASFANSFGGRLGATIILLAIMGLVSFLIITNLASTLIPFAGKALDALDADRFAILGSGLGGLSPIIGSFWAISLCAGFVAMTWNLIQMVQGNEARGGSLFGRRRRRRRRLRREDVTSHVAADNRIGALRFGAGHRVRSRARPAPAGPLGLGDHNHAHLRSGLGGAPVRQPSTGGRWASAASPCSWFPIRCCGATT